MTRRRREWGYGRPVDDAGADDQQPEAEHPDDEAANRTEREEAVVAELERILLDGGPLVLEDLADAFAEAAPELAAGLLAGRPSSDLPALLTPLAQRADEVWRLPDGRLAAVLHHLRRSVLTHRLTAGELERQAIDLLPDLVALALPRATSLRDGTELTTAGPEDGRAADGGSLLGPDGWLAAYQPGDLVAVRYDGSHVRLDPVADAELDGRDGQHAAEALQATFALLEGARAPEAHRLVVDAIGAEPDVFATPVAPLVELLAQVDLRVRGAWVGPARGDWRTPLEEARRRRLDALLESGPRWRRAAGRVLDAWEAWMEAGDGDLPTGPELAALVRDLDDGPVAAALAEAATVGRAVPSVRRLGEWAAEVAARTGATTAGLAFLQARGADAGGDGLAAEAHLRAGLAVAPDDLACLGLLAELVEDRGDAPGALALRRRGGQEPQPAAVADLAPFLADRSVGRNDPCPCGSGRKYKACCAGRSIRRPLLDRCRWLLSKATRHAVGSDPAAARGLEQLFDPSIVGDPTGPVVDSLLFAGGGLARYLDARGGLLPADELDTARAWPGQPMRLLRVEAATPGGPVEAVDQRSGQRLHLAGWPDGPDGAPPLGQTVLARPLPVGEVWLSSGVTLVVPPSAQARAQALSEAEVGPFQLLQLLVDLQVDAVRGQLPSGLLGGQAGRGRG